MLGPRYLNVDPKSLVQSDEAKNIDEINVLSGACMFFKKKMQNMRIRKIVVVSGLWAPPGPRLGGHNYADLDMSFAMRSFWEKVLRETDECSKFLFISYLCFFRESI